MQRFPRIMGRAAVNTRKAPDISISVAALDQLFNAPPVNPFSEKEVDVRGESGMTYLLRQLQDRNRDWRDPRLTIRLPPDQITTGLQPQLSQAIHRYCQVRIENNTQDIHTIRVRSSTGLSVLLAIVVVLIAAVYILFTQIAPDTPQAVQFTIAATISLFAWVSLWDPLEALLFNPIPLMRENRLLRRIMDMNIVVESDTSAVVAPPETRPPNAGAQTLLEEA
jgi:hypothetical protein